MNLQPGSFGISPEGAQQALTNRLAPSRASRLTGIPDNLEAGSFGISEAGAEQRHLRNRINKSRNRIKLVFLLIYQREHSL